MSALTIILIFPVKKVISYESGDKYAQTKHSFRVKTVQSSSKQICWSFLMWEENRGWTFSLEDELMIMDYYFGQKQQLKHPNNRFVYYKHAHFHFTRC